MPRLVHLWVSHGGRSVLSEGNAHTAASVALGYGLPDVEFAGAYVAHHLACTQAQEASAALPEAKAAAAKAAAAVAAPRVAPQPQPAPEAALQVDFDDDDEDGDVAPAVQRPKASRGGRLLAAAPPLSQSQRRPKAAVRILVVSTLNWFHCA